MRKDRAEIKQEGGDENSIERNLYPSVRCRGIIQTQDKNKTYTMKNTILISAFSATLALSSCVSHKMGGENVATTDVRLEQANYRVIATQVKGESTGFHILSAIPNSIPSSLSDLGELVRLSPDGGITIQDATKVKAVEDLYKNCGDLRNRPTALINLRTQTGGTNYFIFSRPKTTVTADVIEFIR